FVGRLSACIKRLNHFDTEIGLVHPHQFQKFSGRTRPFRGQTEKAGLPAGRLWFCRPVAAPLRSSGGPDLGPASDSKKGDQNTSRGNKSSSMCFHFFLRKWLPNVMATPGTLVRQPKRETPQRRQRSRPDTRLNS